MIRRKQVNVLPAADGQQAKSQKEAASRRRMNINKFLQSMRSGWSPVAVIAVTTIAFSAISIYCLASGYFIIFQNLFYIPIIIACVYYTRRGFAFSVIIACLYFLLTITFTRETLILLQAFVRVLIFVLVAGVITYLSLARRRVEESLRQQHDDLEGLVQERTAQLEEDLSERKRAEEALRESEAKFRQTFQFSPVGIVMVGLDKRFIRNNNAFSESLGYAPEELIGKTIADITYPDDVHIGMDEMKAIARGELAISNVQKRYLHKDGRIIWGEATISLIRDHKANPQYFMAIIQDISKRKLAEEALAESEKKLHALFETMSEGIVYEDHAGNIIAANPAAERLLGISLDQMQGRTSLDPRWQAIHEDGSPFPGETHALNIAAKTGKPATGEVMGIFNPRSGAYVWLSVNSTPEFLPGGKEPFRAFAVFRDITERKQAEATLVLNSQRMQTLLQLNQMTNASLKEITDFILEEAVRLTRSTIGYMAFLNEDESVLTMHSWSKSAMAECAIIDKPIVYPVATTGLWGEAVRQRKAVITNNYPAASLLKKGYPQGHVAVKRHMNTPVFAGSRIVMVAGVGNKTAGYDQDDVQQLTLLMEGMWRLIERRRAAEALQESERKFRETVINLDEGYYSVTLDGKLLEHNQAFNRILGFDGAQNLKGVSLPDFWQDPEQRKEYLKAFAASGSITNYQIDAKKQDGEKIAILASAHLVKDENDRSQRIEGVFLDISQRIRAEAEIKQLNEELEQRVQQRTSQLESANKELEAFSYSVSHDLRAPLRAIDGFSRIVLEEYAPKLDDEGRRLLGVITGNTRKMGDLIDDLLSFSRLSRQQMAFAPVNLAAMAKVVFAELKSLEGGRRIELEVGALPVAHGDHSMLQQVLQNLLANAVKFTRTQKPARIELGGKVGKGESIFYVKDNGVGFDMAYADKLFGVFQRLHGADEFEGTGVGLAIVQRIIARHGGRVWAESSKKGATFYFSFPNKGGTDE